MRHDIASIPETARFVKVLTATPNGLCRVNTLKPNKRSYTYMPFRRNTVLTVFRAMPELRASRWGARISTKHSWLCIVEQRGHSPRRLGVQVILLDTHILIWMAGDPKRLSNRAYEAIREARKKTGVTVAPITLWELAWLA